MNSLRMSFWIVPRSFEAEKPLSSAVTIYNASKVAAVAFIVMETDTLSSGILSKSSPISLREVTGTPTFPTSPSAMGLSESYPI